MPLVTINVLNRVFTDEQKREMIKRVTDAVVSIEGEAMRACVWVMIEEVREGNWGIGGQCITGAAIGPPSTALESGLPPVLVTNLAADGSKGDHHGN